MFQLRPFVLLLLGALLCASVATASRYSDAFPFFVDTGIYNLGPFISFDNASFPLNDESGTGAHGLMIGTSPTLVAGVGFTGSQLRLRKENYSRGLEIPIPTPYGQSTAGVTIGMRLRIPKAFRLNCSGQGPIPFISYVSGNVTNGTTDDAQTKVAIGLDINGNGMTADFVYYYTEGVTFDGPYRTQFPLADTLQSAWVEFQVNPSGVGSRGPHIALLGGTSISYPIGGGPYPDGAFPAPYRVRIGGSHSTFPADFCPGIYFDVDDVFIQDETSGSGFDRFTYNDYDSLNLTTGGITTGVIARYPFNGTLTNTVSGSQLGDVVAHPYEVMQDSVNYNVTALFLQKLNRTVAPAFDDVGGSVSALRTHRRLYTSGELELKEVTVCGSVRLVPGASTTKPVVLWGVTTNCNPEAYYWTDDNSDPITGNASELKTPSRTVMITNRVPIIVNGSMFFRLRGSALPTTPALNSTISDTDWTRICGYYQYSATGTTGLTSVLTATWYVNATKSAVFPRPTNERAFHLRSSSLSMAVGPTLQVRDMVVYAGLPSGGIAADLGNLPSAPAPTAAPSAAPALTPTAQPTNVPTFTPTAPTSAPSAVPTPTPTAQPTSVPTSTPTVMPSVAPTFALSGASSARCQALIGALPRSSNIRGCYAFNDVGNKTALLADHSGFGNHLVDGASSPLNFVTTTTTQGSALFFNGSSAASMLRGPLGSLSSSTGFTVYLRTLQLPDPIDDPCCPTTVVAGGLFAYKNVTEGNTSTGRVWFGARQLDGWETYFGTSSPPGDRARLLTPSFLVAASYNTILLSMYRGADNLTRGTICSNGQCVSSTASTDASRPGSEDGGAQIHLGFGADGGYYRGTIDEVVAWNTAMNTTELVSLHRAIQATVLGLRVPVPGNSSSPSGFWNFDNYTDRSSPGSWLGDLVPVRYVANGNIPDGQTGDILDGEGIGGGGAWYGDPGIRHCSKRNLETDSVTICLSLKLFSGFESAVSSASLLSCPINGAQYTETSSAPLYYQTGENFPTLGCRYPNGTLEVAMANGTGLALGGGSPVLNETDWTRICVSVDDGLTYNRENVRLVYVNGALVSNTSYMDPVKGFGVGLRYLRVCLPASDAIRADNMAVYPTTFAAGDAAADAARSFTGFSSTSSPTQAPSIATVTDVPTSTVTAVPTTATPTATPTTATPTATPTTATPTTAAPTATPTTAAPTATPTLVPTSTPSPIPTLNPTAIPTPNPTAIPTPNPTAVPTTASPTRAPTPTPTRAPTASPTARPTARPTASPTTRQPTTPPPSTAPTVAPTDSEGTGLGNGYPVQITLPSLTAVVGSPFYRRELRPTDGSVGRILLTASGDTGGLAVGMVFNASALSARGLRATRGADCPVNFGDLVPAYALKVSAPVVVPAGPIRLILEIPDVPWSSVFRTLYVCVDGSLVRMKTLCESAGMTVPGSISAGDMTIVSACHFSTWVVADSATDRNCLPGRFGCRCSKTNQYRFSEQTWVLLCVSTSALFIGLIVAVAAEATGKSVETRGTATSRGGGRIRTFLLRSDETFDPKAPFPVFAFVGGAALGIACILYPEDDITVDTIEAGLSAASTKTLFFVIGAGVCASAFVSYALPILVWLRPGRTGDAEWLRVLVAASTVFAMPLLLILVALFLGNVLDCEPCLWVAVATATTQAAIVAVWPWKIRWRLLLLFAVSVTLTAAAAEHPCGTKVHSSVLTPLGQ